MVGNGPKEGDDGGTATDSGTAVDADADAGGGGEGGGSVEREPTGGLSFAKMLDELDDIGLELGATSTEVPADPSESIVTENSAGPRRSTYGLGKQVRKAIILLLCERVDILAIVFPSHFERQ